MTGATIESFEQISAAEHKAAVIKFAVGMIEEQNCNVIKVNEGVVFREAEHCVVANVVNPDKPNSSGWRYIGHSLLAGSNRQDVKVGDTFLEVVFAESDDIGNRQSILRFFG